MMLTVPFTTLLAAAELVATLTGNKKEEMHNDLPTTLHPQHPSKCPI